MLYIKMMSNEGYSDSYLGKNYTLVTIGDNDVFQFGEFGPLVENTHNPESKHPGNTEVLQVVRADKSVEAYGLTGNTYVMNESGTTISTRLLRKRDCE